MSCSSTVAFSGQWYSAGNILSRHTANADFPNPRCALVGARSGTRRLKMGFDPALFTASAVMSSVFFVAYEGRPRGGLAVDESMLEAKKSSVSGAGLGLFANANLPAGTCIGCYPGSVWPAGIWLKFKGASWEEPSQASGSVQASRQQRARSYVWRLESGNIIDPTDSEGNLPEEIQSLLGAKISTKLCRINEPSRGFDTNVVTEEQGEELVFRLERDVLAGEELFLDYGPFYDRSGYSSNSLGTLTFPDD